MLKKIVLVFFVAIVSMMNLCYSQTKDSIPGFQYFSISNNQMQDALNELINTADNCPYLTYRNKEYFIVLSLTSREAKFMVYPHNVNTLLFYKNGEVVKASGVCYYNNTLIEIIDYSENQAIDKYFISNDTIISVTIEPNENLADICLPSNVLMTFQYSIVEDYFIKDMDESDVECRDGDGNMFEYLVKKGDTWASIAYKCGCSEKDLKEEYSEYDNPIPGFFIILFYELNNSSKSYKIKRFL